MQRSSSGGALTLLAALIFSWLVWLEIKAYYTIAYEPSLIVDSSLGERLDIHLDIDFPRIPCGMLSVDAMDTAGEVQRELENDLFLTDLDGDGSVLDQKVLQQQQREVQAGLEMNKDLTSCYGAEDHDLPECHSCAQVLEAYSRKQWKVDDGSGFEQCVNEQYPKHLKQNSTHGCHIQGKVSVSRVVGKLHFAAGRSFFSDARHTHDLSTFYLESLEHSWSHRFNRLAFGPAQYGASDPLQGKNVVTTSKKSVYNYYTKVVATEFRHLNGTHTGTSQYSVTVHERTLQGGRDGDHPNSLHRTGGLPGVWLNYDISPMKVVNVERRQQTIGGLALNVCSLLGAVATSAAVINRGVKQVDRALKAKKER